MMEASLGKVIGKIDGEFWGQIYDFEKDGTRLLAAVGAKKPQEMDAVAVIGWGRDILSRMHELYFSGEAGGILEKLKSSIERLTEEFEGVEITSVVISEKALHVAGSGGGVWVKKGNKEGFLMDGKSGGIKSFSGWGEDQQVIVVGNSKFWDTLPVGLLKAAIDKRKEEGEDMLTAEVHGSEKGGGEAGVIIRIQKTVQAATNNMPEKKIEAPRVDWKERLEKLLPKRTGPVFVSYEDKGRKRKQTMWVGVALLVVLGGLAVVGGIKTQRTKEQNSQSNMQIEELVDKFNQAQALVGLNSARSKQLATEIRAGLTTLKGKEKDARLAQIISELPALEDQVSGKKNSNIGEVIDVSLLRAGSSSDQLVLGEGKLWVLDRTGNKVMSVDPVKGNGQVVAGEEKLGKVKYIAYYPGKVEVFSDKGMVECKLGNCSLKIRTDSEWKEVVSAVMFAGNAYLLDRGSNQIWRYQVTDNGFGGESKMGRLG